MSAHNALDGYSSWRNLPNETQNYRESDEFLSTTNFIAVNATLK
jgi:hypothetical protein